jgi:DNA modification methylase
MHDLSIAYLALDTLKPRPTNPRTHTKKQIRQLARSIEVFGFTNPILIDRQGGIIAGHGRVEAAKLLGLSQVPTICLDDMTESQIRAYVLADNKLAENAGWDRELLALELRGLTELNLDFEITVTGFETPEIDVLFGTAADDADDEVPPLDDHVVPITRTGDVWELGDHRLVCGDATNPDVYARLLDYEEAQMVFTDPPYNVPVAGHVSGLGRVHHREFAMASGEMTVAEFTNFLCAIFNNLVRYSVDGSIHYVCMDWRHIGEVIAAADGRFTELKNLCVWAKSNGGMGSLYRSQHELVFVYMAGTAPHVNNVELGRHGRYRTNVWSYPGVNTFGRDRDAELAMHPTVKPVVMVADAILDCSRRGGIVLDPFAGSGTTLVAAEKTGRKGYGIEIDGRYCDTIIRRISTIAGIEAVHASSGLTFADVATERSRQPSAPPVSDSAVMETA